MIEQTRTYYSELNSLLNMKKPIVLRTDISNFVSDYLDVLLFLTKSFDVIVVNFKAKNIIEEFKSQNGDIGKIHLIEGIFESSLQEVEFSVDKLLEKLRDKKVVVIFISPSDFNNESIDETAIFLIGFIKRLELREIPLVSILHTSSNFELLQVISSNSYRVISIRKELLINKI